VTHATAEQHGIHRLSIPTPFMVGRVNCWLIDDDPLTLVDTGPNSGKALDELEQALAAHGRRIEDLRRIVITHQHIDHEGLLGILARRSGAEICTLDLLAPLLEEHTATQERDDALAEALMLRHGIAPDVVTALRAMSKAFRAWGSAGTVDTLLPDGGELAFAGRTLRVLHRPGHSPTDTLFHDESSGILIGGDHLLAHISSNPLISRPVGGRSGEPGAGRPRALLTYLESLRQTAAMDDVSLVLPGHGDPLADASGLIESRLRMHDRRAARIARLLGERGPLSAYEIAHELWGNVAVTQAYLALSEVLGHLDLLVERGEAAEGEEQAGVVRFSPA
jgi:glyoxylase-like metal-dependent hydrolase (beta-lactamase superfamily II)